MLKKIIAYFLIITLSLPIFSSCKQEEKQVFETFEYFDTYSTLTVYCSKEEADTYFDVFESTLKKYHELLDIYNTYDNVTNLKTVNGSARNESITVSKELFDVIEFSVEAYEKTNGKLNVAIGSVTSVWHTVREEATDSVAVEFPSQNTIADALSHTDINSVLLDENKLSITLTDAQTSLDFGGIAKGYVASLLYERLIELDCENFLINLGGNVVASGKKPDGTLWTSAIDNPFEDKSLGYDKTVSLKDMTLVTSGSYQRYFIYKGKSYSHIIDTSNGYPAQRFASVTIQAPAKYSGLADALSTALFCMSYEDGLTLISSMENVDALWIFNDGSYKTSENFGGEK